MLELYQAEWCPYSHQVRQTLTELGLDFVARQVPADKAQRDEMRERTGTDSIPVLVRDDGTVLDGESDEIIAWLTDHYEARADAGQHRERRQSEADFRQG